MKRAVVSWAVAALACSPACARAEGSDAARVVITATREPLSVLAAPMAVDVVDGDALSERNPSAGVAGLLARVPGVVVHHRETLAQEQTIAIRGFGARAAFGVRGIRLLVDGLPASTPDGQGGAAMFDLASAARVEVTRGPFSSLYGNHAAGVVQVFTREAPSRPTVQTSAFVDQHGQARLGVVAGARGERLDAVVSASHTDADGWRDWSRARMAQAHARLRWRLDEATTLAAVVNAFEQPESLDPLGLTAAQMAADPEQAHPEARRWQTRRRLRHALAGLVLDHADADGRRWHATLHGAQRRNLQMLAFPGSGAASAGGVSGFDRDQAGLALRVTLPLAQGRLVLGAERERAAELRRGWVNAGGEPGPLKREQTDTVAQAGIYAQGHWEPALGWDVHAGLRRSWVNFDSRDRYIAPGNPDDSGSARYAAWTPAVGVARRLSPGLSAYASAGRSFETPTFAELAYRPGGASGLHFDLQPSVGRHVEAGLRGTAPWRWQLTAFGVETRDEIVVASAAGGRTVYRNAGATRRHGIEASADADLAPTLAVHVAATWLRARFAEPFTTPAGPVAAGARLPGVPETTLQAELAWTPSGPWSAALEMQARGAVPADDRGSEAAGGAAVLAARLAWEKAQGPWRWRARLRVDNLGDRRWASAVYVNDSNGRYYAPAAPRTVSLGVELTRRWP